MQETKATFKILLFFTLLGIAIIVPLLVFQDLNYSDDDFLEYEKINISERKLKDETEYNNIKQQLENDYYFQKLSIMMEYDSKNYTSAILDEMIWHFIFNYDVTNNGYFSYTDAKNEIYCLSNERFIEAFKELYDVDITDDASLLKGYYEYIYDKSQGYCLDFGNVSLDYDNDIKIAIEKITMSDAVITADLYVYEYYTPEVNDPNVIDLENAIKTSNYIGAQNITKNKLYGKVTHKQIQFKINKYGDYFKYKILSMKKLDY